MPREHFGPDYQYLPRSAVLSFEEISRLAAIFATLGAEKLRLTGGEPLLRRDLHKLIQLLRSSSKMELAMTTNGSLLEGQVDAIAGPEMANLISRSLGLSKSNKCGVMQIWMLHWIVLLDLLLTI